MSKQMSVSRPLVVAAAAAVALCCSTVASAAIVTPAGVVGPPTATDSWVAEVLYPTPARKTPAGPAMREIKHYTQWSQANAVFMVTDATTVNGRNWIRVQLPFRPNGLQGWMDADALEVKRITTRIRVSTGRRRVEVLRDGSVIKSFRVAVGTGRTPTPHGKFAIYDKVRSGGQLGPWILVLTAHSNVLKTFAGGDGIVGIHGWPTSNVLGKAVSNGCVRMSRANVTALAKFAVPGVPVTIGA